MTATTRAFPGQVFTGGLTFVYPHLDPDTRTVVARFELDNPDHKLRPGTSAQVKVRVPSRNLEILGASLAKAWWKETAVAGLRQTMSPGGMFAAGVGLDALVRAADYRTVLINGLVLAVPETAVIDTGDQRIVYRELVSGQYEGVRVVLGPRMVGPEDVKFYPVLRGLEAGDLVVTAGSFLIDAETRLNPAAGSVYFGGSSGPRSQAGIIRPSTPAEADAKAQAGLSSDDRRLLEAQKLCPITGERLGAMGVPVKIMVMGQLVFLCCDACDEAARRNSATTLAKVTEMRAKSKGSAK